MKILAAFYTNNRARPQLLEQNIKHFVSSWQTIPGLPCQNLISHFQVGQHGHLNILLQLLQVIHSTDDDWDYFAFCEHDCLYPPDYFLDIARRFQVENVPGLASENHLGLRPYGFAKSWYHTQPLFAMVIGRDRLLAALYSKLRECVLNGSCCIEPENRANWIIVAHDDASSPILHVNMETTCDNHHLTSHHDFYSLTEVQEVHPFWGKSCRFGVFT